MLKYNKITGKFIFVLGLLVIPSMANALSFDEMILNLQSVINPFIVLVLMVSYIAGIVMIIRGIIAFKQFGASLTQQSRPGELGGPLVYIIVGTILLSLPEVTMNFSVTLLGGEARDIFDGNKVDITKAGNAASELLSYADVPIEQKWADVVRVIIYFVNFIGFVAFVRGWFIISKAGQPGVQPGTISKGIIHLLAGIVAINFIPFFQVLAETIGF